MKSLNPRDIPSLSGLKAFEAAARHLSFRKAAEELCLTPSAVSHQIKKLESYLNITLFDRLTGNIQLTESGEKYFREIKGPLASLALASREISKATLRKNILTLSLLPMFATRWLIPRLSSFQQLCPEIELRLSTSVSPVDFYSSDVDVAIRYGDGNWLGVYSERLIDEFIFPVCSPDFLKKNQHTLNTPSDLVNTTLLHNDSHENEWGTWLYSFGVNKTSGNQNLNFASSELSLRAAVEGLGVALGRNPLVDEELESGRLIKLCNEADNSSTKKAYFFVCLPEALQQSNVAVFRKWLINLPNP